MIKYWIPVLLYLTASASCYAADPETVFLKTPAGDIVCEAGELECTVGHVQTVDFGQYHFLVKGETVRQHQPVDEFDSGKESQAFLALCRDDSDHQMKCSELLKGRTSLYRFEPVDVDLDGRPEWVLMGSTGFHSSFIDIFSPGTSSGVETVFSHITNTPNLQLEKDDRGYFVEFEQIDYDPDYETGSRNLHRIRVNY